MERLGQSIGRLSAVGTTLAPRIWIVLGPAAVCLALGYLLWPGIAAQALALSGFVLVWLFVWVRGLDWLDRRRQNALRRTVAELIADSPEASFGSDRNGRILCRSRAANSLFPLRQLEVAEILADRFADSAEVVRRMASRAASDGSAQEVTACGRPTLRLSVQRIGGGQFLWRMHETGRCAGAAQSVEPAMPMLSFARTGTILSMNDAMQALLGGRPATLDRIVSDLPLRDGQVHRISTPTGLRELRVAVIETGDGARQVFIWPAAPPETRWSQFEALPVPLVKISPEGQILMANRRARDMLALDRHEDANFAEVVEGLGRPVAEWLLDVVEGRGANRPEIVRARLSERELFLQVVLGRVTEAGEVALLAVLIDATELKTLEAQFVQSQKMQAIGQLAGGVAHDFNNLLTAINGHCDLLLLRHDPGDPDYGDLMQITQNANRAASLVGQLLAFSRKQNMRPELIDLRDTLGDLAHLLNRLVGEKIQLTCTHDADLPWIRADKRQLEQVMMNLVVNARDAMPAGGRITITTRSERLTTPLKRDRASVPSGDYVVVTVEDEGHGIPPDKLPKIFEPFFSTKRVGEGTGLGLSMAYGIVKQSGGFIFADSVVGQGTSFRLFFPAHRGHALLPHLAEPAPKRRLARHEGGVVLLVEDEAPVRAFASRALRLRGYTVLEADSAEEALKTLDDATLEVDVFVTDVVMPGMDGPSWVSKALETRPNTRVVFVSGYAEDSFSHQRARIPNSVFLPKPFSLGQLTETVQGQFA